MEGFRKNLKKLLVYGGTILAGFILFSSAAHAATLFLAPSSSTYNVGNGFSITVKVNAGGVPINAAEGTIAFNPNELSVTSLSKSGSIFNLWVQEPDFSNALGTINFGGIIFNPGYTGASGTLLTVNLKAKAVSNALLSFSSGAVLANDGLGTNILSAMNGGAYSLKTSSVVPQTTPESPVPEGSSISIPVIKSQTHPDQSKWHSNNNPELSWTLPEGIDNVSYLLNQKPDSNPGSIPDGLKNSVNFTNTDDGIWYFHIKFRKSGKWGPIAHYKLQIDTVPPKDFIITRVDNNPTSAQPELLFDASDDLSGIDHYEMRMGGGNWFTIDKAVPGIPYKMPPQVAGRYVVEIKAVDKAGNSTISLTTIEISGGVTVVRLGILGTIFKFIVKLYDYFINGISRGTFFIGFIVVLAGLLISLFELFKTGIGKWWHKIRQQRELAVTENKSLKKLSHLVNDIEDEIKFLQSMDRRRRLSPEEKYLKTKLEQYLKTLKMFKRKD